MATVNHRSYRVFASIFNGVSVGGTTMVSLQKGYESVITTTPDGLQVPIRDREIQYCRGTITTQDWSLLASILAGTVGTYVFYERTSGVAELTGYTKHTITAPVVNSVAINLSKGQYGTLVVGFECKAADETKGFLAMHTVEEGQAAPTHIAAGYGGFRIESLAHGAVDILHVMSLSFAMTIPLLRACNDADIGYTAVDQDLNGMTPNGSIMFEDGEIATTNLLVDRLLAASSGSLVAVVTQSSGGSDKTVTIAGVQFETNSSEFAGGYAGYTLPFQVTNDPDTPLTIAGANKIIAVA